MGSSDLEPGLLVDGTYRITYVLGHGSMGTVYLALDETLQRKVAIKVLAGKFRRDEALVSRFQKEAVAMARVRHPNVVQIYAYGQFRNLPYFVMEYVAGESLADLIERRNATGDPIHVDEAVGIMTQTCKGVAAIHREGIVHRDLKPANILLGEDFRVAVADFGLVRPVQYHSVSEGAILDGTPMYLAPERIQGLDGHEVSPHLSDIYAMGAIFYELLTGLPPYEYEGVLQVLDAHLSAPPPSALAVRSDLPKAVDRIIAKAMAKDPSERYQDCSELLSDLMDTRPRSWSGPRRATQERTIVVAESQPQNVEAIVRSLKFAYPEATVLTVLDGTTALRLIRDTNPELVILDEETPGLNALEVCAHLTEQGRGSSRPAILVTAKKVDALRRKLFQELGVLDLVPKPSDPSGLLDVLSRVLDKGEDKGEEKE